MIVEITACPSCAGKIQSIKGNRFYCEACDTIFRIHREGPKVETVGALDALAGRMDRIEKTIGETGPVQDPKPAADLDDDEQLQDDDEQLQDEDEQLQDDDNADEVNELWGD